MVHYSKWVRKLTNLQAWVSDKGANSAYWGPGGRHDPTASRALRRRPYHIIPCWPVRANLGQGASRPMPVKSSSPPTRVALRPCGGLDRPLARQTGCLGHRPAKAALGRHSVVVMMGGVPPDPVRQTCRPAMLKATETSRPPWPSDCPAKGTCPFWKLAAGFAQSRRCDGVLTARGDRGRPGSVPELRRATDPWSIWSGP